MDSRPLKVFHFTWHWDIDIRSLESHGVEDGPSIPSMFPLYPTNAQLHWDIGSVEARSKLCALCHVPQINVCGRARNIILLLGVALL